MDFNAFAAIKKTTPKRVKMIYSNLFGDMSVPDKIAELHISGVLTRIAGTKETLGIACAAYKREVEEREATKNSSNTMNDNPEGERGLNDQLKKDKDTAKKLTIKRFVAIIKDSNQILADWLRYGISSEDLTSELRDALEESEEELRDALNAIDGKGNYLPPQLQGESILGWLPSSLPSLTEKYADAEIIA